MAFEYVLHCINSKTVSKHFAFYFTPYTPTPPPTPQLYKEILHIL